MALPALRTNLTFGQQTQAPREPVVANEDINRVNGQLFYINQELKSVMGAGPEADYARASQLREERTRLMTSPEGTKSLQMIRSLLTSLGNKANMAGQDAVAELQSLLPGELEKSLASVGQPLSLLDNERSKAFYAKLGVPGPDADRLAMITDPGRTPAADTPDYFDSWQLKRAYEKAKYDAPTARAIYDKYQADIVSFRRLTSTATTGNSEFKLGAADRLYNAAAYGDLDAETVGGLYTGILKSARAKETSVAGEPKADPVGLDRLAVEAVEQHASLASKTPGYNDALRVLQQDQTLLGEKSIFEYDVGVIAPRIAAAAKGISVARGNPSLSGSQKAIAYRKVLSQARVPGVQAPSEDEWNEVRAAWNAPAVAAVVVHGEADDVDQISSSDTAAMVKQVLPNMSPTAIVSMGEEAEVTPVIAAHENLQTASTEFTQLAARDRTGGSYGLVADTIGVIADPEASVSEKRYAARALLTEGGLGKVQDTLGVALTPDMMSAIKTLAENTPDTTAGKSYLGRDAAVQQLTAQALRGDISAASVRPGSAAVKHRQLARTFNNQIGRGSRNLGTAVHQLSRMAYVRSVTPDTLEEHLDQSVEVVPGVSQPLRVVLESSEFGRILLDEARTRATEASQNPIMQKVVLPAKGFLAALGEVATQGPTAAIGGAVRYLAGKEGDSATSRFDPSGYGTRIMNELLAQGHIKTAAGGTLEFSTAAAGDRAPSAVAAGGAFQTFGKEFDPAKDPNAFTEMSRHIASQFSEQFPPMLDSVRGQPGRGEREWTWVSQLSRASRKYQAAVGAWDTVSSEHPGVVKKFGEALLEQQAKQGSPSGGVSSADMDMLGNGEQTEAIRQRYAVERASTNARIADLNRTISWLKREKASAASSGQLAAEKGLLRMLEAISTAMVNPKLTPGERARAAQQAEELLARLQNPRQSAEESPRQTASDVTQ